VIRGDTQTHREHGDLISILVFSQNTENWLKMVIETSGEGKEGKDVNKERNILCRERNNDIN
jgi:hypothetical protein